MIDFFKIKHWELASHWGYSMGYDFVVFSFSCRAHVQAVGTELSLYLRITSSPERCRGLVHNLKLDQLCEVPVHQVNVGARVEEDQEDHLSNFHELDKVDRLVCWLRDLVL